jgi:hypothetical protein
MGEMRPEWFSLLSLSVSIEGDHTIAGYCKFVQVHFEQDCGEYILALQCEILMFPECWLNGHIRQ